MSRFGPKTVRAKLTLMTMLVMGGLLGALGVSVDFAAHKAVLYGIDDDLLHHGRAISHGPPPGMGLGGPPMGLPPFDNGHEPGFHSGHWEGHGPDSHDHLPPFDHVGPRDMDLEDGINPVPHPQHFDIGENNNHQVSYNIEAFARAKRFGKPVWTIITKDGKPYRLLTLPTVFDGKVIKIVEVLSPLEDVEKALSELRQVLITIVIPVGMVVTGLASLYLISRWTKPLRLITQNAESIGAHNAAERLPVKGRDEFASVAITLNRMLDRLEAGLRLEQMTNRHLEQTVQRQRRFTEDASHELKTPLAVIKANTGLMLHFGGNAEENREAVQSIDQAAGRMNSLVQDLLVLARAEAGQLLPRFEPIDLRFVIENAPNHLVRCSDRVILYLPAEPTCISGSTDDLSRVFVNLIDNALRHSGSECPVEVRLTADSECAVVMVRDFGDGIPPEHLPRLFDRFYRIDRSRSSDTGGTGLGLAICKGIVEAHHGTIEVASTRGEGTVFTVRLPTISSTFSSSS